MAKFTLKYFIVLRNRYVIVPILIFFLVLFNKRPVFSQTLVFEIQTTDNQMYEAPIFKLNGRVIEINRKSGLYHIDSIFLNDKVEISSKGYVPFEYFFSSSTKDSIFEIFTLFPKIQEISEVTIRLQNIQKLDGSENVHIVDYMPGLNEFWSIRKIRNKYYLYYNSDLVIDSILLENKKAIAIQKDCNDAVFLLTNKETFEVRYLKKIELKFCGDNKFYEEKIKPIIAIEDTNIFIEGYSIHNQNYTLSHYKKNKNSVELLRIFDKVAAQVAQSNWNEIIAYYYSVASETENVIENGNWTGNMMELCIDPTLNRMITWYLKIRARPIECKSIGMMDNLCIIDLRNYELHQLDYNSSAVVTKRIPNDKGKITSIIHDFTFDRIYFTIQTSNLFVKLYLFDYKINSLIFVKDLQPLGTIENVKIFGSNLYFLSISESGFNKLYKLKIPI